MAERRTRTTRLDDEQHSPRSRSADLRTRSAPGPRTRPAESRGDLDEADRYRGRHEAYGEAAGWTRRKAVVAIAGTTLAAAACTRAATSPKVRGLVEPGLHNIFGDNLNAAVPAAPPLTPPSAPGGPEEMAGAPSGGAATYEGSDASWAKAGTKPSGGAAKKAPPRDPNVGQTTTLKDAAARTVSVHKTPLSDSPVLHLASRMTFGVTPALINELVATGPDAWFKKQLAAPTTAAAALGPLAAEFPLLETTAQQARQAGDNNNARDQLKQATLARQMWSPSQLHEVMVDFWANFFNVDVNADGIQYTRHVYDTTLRKLALTNFTSLLLAVGRDPAMLRYLNQNDSTKGKVNENFGRELLELYSLGVNGGYSQADVFNFAIALTGRNYDENGAFEYRANDHQTGPVKVLGITYPNATAEGGLALGDTILQRLAAHPSTAKFVATKLAVRFVADVPPPTLVARLAASFVKNKGDIKALLTTLATSFEFWAARGAKVLRPTENLVSTARALGVRPGEDVKKGLDDLYGTTALMGHAPLAWGPPNGYPDVKKAWESSGNMVRLWDLHRGLVQGANKSFQYVAPEAQFGAVVPATYGAAVDVLTRRLTGQKFTQPHRAALLAFLGAAETTPVASPDLKDMVQHVIPLIFDSPYKTLR